MSDIPILDGAKPDRQLAADFFAAYSEVGFAYLVNHGVPPEVTRDLFAASAAFHALDESAKAAVALDRNHRGFIALNTSTDVNSDLAAVTKPNQSESFMIMREDAAETGEYLSGPNQWPDLPRFRSACETYANALTALGRRMMRVAAQSLGAAPDAFDASFARPTTWLRLLRYPPAPPQRPEDLWGAAPHTDFGCLTFLAQDDAGGLQVMSPEGDWLDAPPRPDALIVNVGDMLQRWSNGRLRSTPHRVINVSGRERFSCPFFFDPNVETEVAPLDACVSPDAPAAFERVHFGAFLRSELEAGYDAHQSTEAASG